jgi:hypothetical protein
MIGSSCCNVYIEHCKHGRMRDIEAQFRENTTKQNKALVAFHFYQGFRFACEHGHVAVAKYIASKINKEEARIAMFSASDEYALRHACANGHTDVVQWILLHHTSINIHMLDNYAFRKACLNGHMDIVALLLPWMHPSTLLLLFDMLSDETKIFIIDWIAQHPNKITHIKRMFSHLCIGGKVAIAQHIYNYNCNRSLSTDDDGIEGNRSRSSNALECIQTKQWDTIFRRTSYNYKFSTVDSDKKIQYRNVLQWVSSLFPDRYFVRANAADDDQYPSKCFILPLRPRADIPAVLVQEKIRCELCQNAESDLIGCCGHQYCTPCTVTTLTHPDAIYPCCAHCQLHMDQCYPSTYDYEKIRQDTLPIRGEIIQNRFHPRNIHKFNSWGIDGFSDDDDEYD